MHFLAQHLTRRSKEYACGQTPGLIYADKFQAMPNTLVSFLDASFQNCGIDYKIAMFDSYLWVTQSTYGEFFIPGIFLRYFWKGELSLSFLWRFHVGSPVLPVTAIAGFPHYEGEPPEREVEGKEWTSSCRNFEGICIGEEDRSYTFNFGYYDGR